MPDKRKHRGAHPEDAKLFSPDQIARIRQAVVDLSSLLTRNYSIKSSLKLVGDHHRLNERQRSALQKASCSDQQRESRNAKLDDRISGKNLCIDGFNLIITLEAALSGGVILLCRDGCLRDLSSVHGSYRSVDETDRAINLAGKFLSLKKSGTVRWFLDRPVSNSGRLAQRITDIASRNKWSWTTELVNSPDHVLASTDETVVTSDSTVLDKARRWVNLSRLIVESSVPDAWVTDLGTE